MKARFLVPLLAALACLAASPVFPGAGPGLPPPFQVLDAGERVYENGPALAVVFSAPLSTKKGHGRHIRVSDEGGEVESAWVLSDDRRVLFLPFVEPETEYSLVVMKSLEDEQGRNLEKRFFKTITTRKITPGVSFLSGGLILPRKYTEGLPVALVNVAEVDVDFYRVREESLGREIPWHGLLRKKQWYGLPKRSKSLVHAYTARFELKPEKNKRVVRHLAVQKIKPLQEPGVYLAVMRQPGDYDYSLQSAYFLVTGLGLHARVYGDHAQVFARSIKTGEPLSGVSLFLQDKTGLKRELGVTDSRGRCVVEEKVTEKDNILVARGKAGFALLSFQTPALDMSEFDLGKRRGRERELFLYGPRDLYRPGEKVMVSALLRDGDGKMAGAPPLSVKWLAPDGRTQKSANLAPGEEGRGVPGYYQAELQLPKDAVTGKWRLRAMVDPASRQSVDFVFHVEEFLPERMKLDLSTRAEFLLPGYDWEVEGQGAYLYGAPAAGNQVAATGRIRASRNPVPKYKGFVFGNADNAEFVEYWDLEKTAADKEGRVNILVKNRWKAFESPMEVRLGVSLLESGGRPVTRAITTTMWPAYRMPGIRPLFGDFLESPGPAGFEVIVAGAHGELHDAPALAVSIIKKNRDYYWEYTDQGGWKRRHTDQDYEVFSGVAQAWATGPAPFEADLDYGSYLIKVTDQETGMSASVDFQVGWQYWWNHAGNGDKNTARPDKVELSLDKALYRPGDTARVRVAAPAPGPGVVLVEAGELLWSKEVDVPAGGMEVEIPIPAGWDRHDIYVSALVFRPAFAREKVAPNRAVGLIHLPMDREDRRLQVDIRAPEKVLPERPLAVEVQVGAAAGQKVFVTLAAVDRGILNITDFPVPNPFGFFFAQRRFAVSAWDLYGRIIENTPGRRAGIRWGGGGDSTPGGKRPETRVRLVSLFSGLVEADARGRAQVSLEVPDFSGALRLSALAFTGDRFGSAEKDVRVAAPIVTQLSLPRFLAPGDECTLALDVDNLTGQDARVSLDLGVSGLAVVGDPSREVILPEGEKTTLYYQARALPGEGAARFTLAVDSGGYTASRNFQLGVRPPFPAQLIQKKVFLEPGEGFHLSKDMADGLVPETFAARLSVSPFVAINVGDALKGLITYPYGCLEQTTSRAFPLVFATPGNLGLAKLPFLAPRERVRRIDKAIARLSSKQKPSGGFALWGNDGPEEAWLTCYAADFLRRAREKGLDVPPHMLNRALDRLSRYQKKGAPLPDWIQRDQLAGLDFGVKSYAGFVLSQAGRGSLGSLRSLYDRHAKEAGSPLPLVHLGLALSSMGDHRRAGEALEKAGALRREGRRWTGDYGSPIRDLALSLALLLEAGKGQGQAGVMSRDLDEMLQERRWLSTQEKFALFLAGINLARAPGRSWAGQLKTGTEKQGLSRSGPWETSLSLAELRQGIFFANQGALPLFVSASARGYPVKPPQPDTRCFDITRTLYDLGGGLVEENRFSPGDLALVHLEVRSKKWVPDAMVVDLLPAGFELENPRLGHSAPIDDVEINGRRVRDWRLSTSLSHQEFLDDRYMAAACLEKDRTAHFFYQVRAVTPGTFQVPPTLVESMYRPEIRGMGKTPANITVETQ